MKLRILALLGLMLCVLSGPAVAGSINGMQQSAVCDPTTNQGLNCIKPNADGSLNSAFAGGTASLGNTYSNAQPGSWVSGTLTAFMTGTTPASLLAAPGGSLHNYLTDIVCWDSHATVSTGVDVQDGSGGTVIYSLPVSAVYGGAVISLKTPLKQPTAATALFVVDETTGASVKCSATGFTQ